MRGRKEQPAGQGRREGGGLESLTKPIKQHDDPSSQAIVVDTSVLTAAEVTNQIATAVMESIMSASCPLDPASTKPP